ncbi:MAG: NUDIX domain-containing protein [Vicinamibacterales bacterium]
MGTLESMPMPVVRQAGAIAVRDTAGDVEVFVVRARKNPADWIFPKGHIEPGEDAPTAAARELLEEGGVVGRVADWIGTSAFTLGVKQIEVAYYLVHYERDGLAAEQRESRWLSFAAARDLLTFEDHRTLLGKAEQLLPRD